MIPTSEFRSLIATARGLKKVALPVTAFAFAALASDARAANDTWTGASDALWSNTGNWLTNNVPGSSDTATFNGASSHAIVDLGAGVTLGTLSFDTSSVAAYTIGSGGAGSQTLTLGATGNAITMHSTVAANQLINANIALSVNGNNTFTNDSATNTLTVAGGISASTAGAKTLIVTGTGNTSISGIVADGSGTVALNKSGTGAATFSGANTFTGAVTVSQGTLNVSGGNTQTLTGQITVGSALTAGATTVSKLNISNNTTLGSSATAFTGYAGNGNNSLGVINIASGSTLSFTPGAGNAGGNIGNSTNSAGAIFNAGTLSSNAAAPGGAGFFLGNAAGAYGYLQSSGTTTIAGRLNIGQNATGAGVVDINGGTTSVDGTTQTVAGRALQLNEKGGGSAQLNVTNGGVLSLAKVDTFTINNTNGAGAGYGSVNVTGAGSKIALTGASGVSFANNTASSVGTVTLGSGAGTGGQLEASFVDATGTTSTNVLTFNGGTLKATAADATGLIRSNVSTFVQAGGGTIDNGGFVTIVQAPLQAPSGNGVTGSDFTATANNSFLGAPVVKFSGGGGTGAAGYAVFDAVNGKVTSIVITSPGSGYTSAPTITLVGGTAVAGNGAAAFATTYTGTTGAVSSGGMTFNGSGTTILSAANTYTGATILNGGTLRLDSTGSLAGSTSLAVASGATLELDNNISLNDPIVLSLVNGATLNLNFVGAEIIGGLSLNGQLAPAGTYTVSQLGALTGAGTISFTGSGSLTVAAVPEPGVCALLGIGLAGILFLRRRI